MLKYLKNLYLNIRFNLWVRKKYVNRLEQLLKSAQHILFVCKGNICRSAFAEEYAKSILNNSFEISSCGYWTDDGKMSDQTAQKVAQSFGVDLSMHRTRMISEELMNKSDIIFTFDYESITSLCRKYPFIRHKLFLLGLLTKNNLIIRDPFGKDESDFREVFKMIREGVDNLASRVNRIRDK